MGSRLIKIDPREVGLSPRADVMSGARSQYFIIKDRKSRIIMKDGHQILQQAEIIREHVSGAEISLATSAPVCSKTEAFLGDNGINTLSLADLPA